MDAKQIELRHIKRKGPIAAAKVASGLCSVTVIVSPEYIQCARAAEDSDSESTADEDDLGFDDAEIERAVKHIFEYWKDVSKVAIERINRPKVKKL